MTTRWKKGTCCNFSKWQRVTVAENWFLNKDVFERRTNWTFHVKLLTMILFLLCVLSERDPRRFRSITTRRKWRRKRREGRSSTKNSSSSTEEFRLLSIIRRVKGGFTLDDNESRFSVTLLSVSALVQLHSCDVKIAIQNNIVVAMEFKTWNMKSELTCAFASAQCELTRA